jgi:hypothetical protein
VNSWNSPVTTNTDDDRIDGRYLEVHQGILSLPPTRWSKWTTAGPSPRYTAARRPRLCTAACHGGRQAAQHHQTPTRW